MRVSAAGRKFRQFFFLTSRAQTLELNIFAAQAVSSEMDFRHKRALQRRIVQLGDAAALLADHQNAMRAMGQVVTRSKRVDGFDAMHQARSQQKIECAIDRRRCRSGMRLLHLVEQSVCFCRTAGIQQ